MVKVTVVCAEDERKSIGRCENNDRHSTVVINRGELREPVAGIVRDME